uniref:Secreted protein n=1 Tax=Ascaris lumbricoides TaxID=6252 RepID=A0A0M3HYM1_ASCLU
MHRVMVTAVLCLLIGLILPVALDTVQDATMPYFLQISTSEARDQYYKIHGNSRDLTKQQLEDMLRKWAKEQGEEVSVSCFTSIHDTTLKRSNN